MFRLYGTLIFALISPCLWAQSSLHYSLNEGDKFVIEQIAEQIITQDIQGEIHEMENKISGLMEFNVAKVEEQQYELEMIFLNLTMQMTSSQQGELMNVNASEVVEGDVQSRIFHSLLNVPISVVLSKNGDVQEVKGVDSLIQRMTKASGLIDLDSKNTLEESLRREFGSEALSNSFEQMTYFYPDQQDSIPQHWVNEYHGKLSAKNAWSLESSTDSLNVIKGKADIVLNINEGGTSMLLNGTQQTRIATDASSGFLQDMSVDGVAEGVATTQYSGNMEIPTTVKSHTTYKLIRE